MNIIGVICEYNPFHNGHIYHLEKIKEMYPNSLVILVMSSSFTQRGEVSILNKWEKTNIALNYGVDLVVELPFIYSSQAADIFSYGAVNILNKLKVEKIIFGSESNNKEELINIAKIQLENKEYDKLVKSYLDKGENYPTAMSKALQDISGVTVNLPNDLLGLSYTKEILKIKSNIDVVTIQRTNDFHNTELNNKIVSAKAIRNNLDNDSIKEYVPMETFNYLKDKKTSNNYFLLLKYKILNEGINISKYQTVDEGIHNRILKYINVVDSMDELISKIKTKRYTYNKLSRMFTHILCSFTKEEAKDLKINYIRVLGFNKFGKNYLNKIKKDIDVPIITNLSKDNCNILGIENRVDKIYSLLMNDKDNDIRKKPIVK